MSITHSSPNFEIYFAVIELSNGFRSPLVSIRVDENGTLAESAAEKANKYIAYCKKTYNLKEFPTFKKTINEKLYYKQHDGTSQKTLFTV